MFSSDLIQATEVCHDLVTKLKRINVAHLLSDKEEKCKKPKYVAFFDIDDTLLINHKPNLGMFYPCLPIIDLYKHCTNQLHIKPVVITARPMTADGAAQDWTKQQLLEIGCSNFDLYMAPKTFEYEQDFWTFKKRCREDFVNNLNTSLQNIEPKAILAVGDKWWDVISSPKYICTKTIYGSCNENWIGSPDDSVWISYKVKI